MKPSSATPPNDISSRASARRRQPQRPESDGSALPVPPRLPPLALVKFATSVPRLDSDGNASIFADIDGYTKFVMRPFAGSREIRKAVETIHVIREELNSVLKDDFGGKRIRFIGRLHPRMHSGGARQTTNPRP